MTNPVDQMFGRIARVYDLLNHVLSFGIDRVWRKKLASSAITGPEARILDLACGTMDVCLEIQNQAPLAQIIGVDFCLPMLSRGAKKIRKKQLENVIAIAAGDALAIPVGNNSVNSVTMAFGIRNISDRVDAFREMYRCLVPGGKVCILEFGSAQEKIWGGTYNWYLNKILPQIGKLVGHDKDAYDYLARTIRHFPRSEKLGREMSEAGFRDVAWQRLTGGIVCLHWGFKLEIAI